eukprot:gene12976-8828_t
MNNIKKKTQGSTARETDIRYRDEPKTYCRLNTNNNINLNKLWAVQKTPRGRAAACAMRGCQWNGPHHHHERDTSFNRHLLAMSGMSTASAAASPRTAAGVVSGSDFCALVRLPHEEALRVVLGQYERMGLQATQVGLARGLVRDILRRRAAGQQRVFVSYTSNLISCGLRDTFVYLARERLVDGFISTAGGIEEDIIKCLGPTLLGQFGLQGIGLRKAGLNRIGNLLVPNDNYCHFEDFFMPLLQRIHEEQRACRWADHTAPSQFIRRMAQELAARHPDVCEQSLLYWCFKHDIPVFCPAFTDGSMGDMIYFYNFSKKGLVVDPMRDVALLRRLASDKPEGTRTAALVLGGGLPKHHLLHNMPSDDVVLITTGSEAEGCTSSSILRDDASCGLLQQGSVVVRVQGDATLIFPLLLCQEQTKTDETLPYSTVLTLALEASHFFFPSGALANVPFSCRTPPLSPPCHTQTELNRTDAMPRLHCAQLLGTLALLVVFLFSGAAANTEVQSKGYRIERRIGEEAPWAEVASFSLTRSSASLPPRLRAVNAPRRALSDSDRNLLGTAELLYYRVTSTDQGDGDGAAHTTLAVTPCTIIRGFQAVDKTQLLLRELLNVVPDQQLGIVGLQIRSETNSFHANMVKDSACDRTVVTSLFAAVDVEAEVGLVGPVEVRPVRYEDLKRIMDPESEKKQKTASKKPRQRHSGADGEEDEKAPPEETSFFGKYWAFFLIPLLISLFSNKQQPAAGNAKEQCKRDERPTLSGAALLANTLDSHSSFFLLLLLSLPLLSRAARVNSLAKKERTHSRSSAGMTEPSLLSGPSSSPTPHLEDSVRLAWAELEAFEAGDSTAALRLHRLHHASCADVFTVGGHRHALGTLAPQLLQRASVKGLDGIATPSIPASAFTLVAILNSTYVRGVAGAMAQSLDARPSASTLLELQQLYWDTSRGAGAVSAAAERHLLLCTAVVLFLTHEHTTLVNSMEALQQHESIPLTAAVLGMKLWLAALDAISDPRIPLGTVRRAQQRRALESRMDFLLGLTEDAQRRSPPALAVATSALAVHAVHTALVSLGAGPGEAADAAPSFLRALPASSVWQRCCRLAADPHGAGPDQEAASGLICSALRLCTLLTPETEAVLHQGLLVAAQLSGASPAATSMVLGCRLVAAALDSAAPLVVLSGGGDRALLELLSSGAQLLLRCLEQGEGMPEEALLCACDGVSRLTEVLLPDPIPPMEPTDDQEDYEAIVAEMRAANDDKGRAVSVLGGYLRCCQTAIAARAGYLTPDLDAIEAVAAAVLANEDLFDVTLDTLPAALWVALERLHVLLGPHLPGPAPPSLLAMLPSPAALHEFLCGAGPAHYSRLHAEAPLLPPAVYRIVASGSEVTGRLCQRLADLLLYAWRERGDLDLTASVSRALLLLGTPALAHVAPQVCPCWWDVLTRASAHHGAAPRWYRGLLDVGTGLSTALGVWDSCPALTADAIVSLQTPAAVQLQLLCLAPLANEAGAGRLLGLAAAAAAEVSDWLPEALASAYAARHAPQVAAGLAAFFCVDAGRETDGAAALSSRLRAWLAGAPPGAVSRWVLPLSAPLPPAYRAALVVAGLQGPEGPQEGGGRRRWAALLCAEAAEAVMAGGGRGEVAALLAALETTAGELGCGERRWEELTKLVECAAAVQEATRPRWWSDSVEAASGGLLQRLVSLLLRCLALWAEWRANDSEKSSGDAWGAREYLVRLAACTVPYCLAAPPGTVPTAALELAGASDSYERRALITRGFGPLGGAILGPVSGGCRARFRPSLHRATIILTSFRPKHRETDSIPETGISATRSGGTCAVVPTACGAEIISRGPATAHNPTRPRTTLTLSSWSRVSSANEYRNTQQTPDRPHYAALAGAVASRGLLYLPLSRYRPLRLDLGARSTAEQTHTYSPTYRTGRQMASAAPKFFWKHLKLPPGTGQPPHGCCHTLVTYKNRYLIAFGGASLTAFSKDVYVYDLEHREMGWEHQTTLHSQVVTSRMVHSAAIYKNKMVVYGGCSQGPNVQLLDDVVALDLDTWTWGSLGSAPDLTEGPGAREFHTAHVFGDRMYVMMGLKTLRHQSLVWYLDLLRGTWHEVQVATGDTAPAHALGGHAAAVEHDTVYVFGGTDLREGRTTNELYTFNLRTHRWRRIPAGNPPPARYGAALAVWRGVVYLFGGDQTPHRLFFGDFWRIDTTAAAPVWEEIPLHDTASVPPARLGKTQMVPRSWSNLERPSPRSGCAYTTARGAFFLLGGEGFKLHMPAPQNHCTSLGYPSMLVSPPLADVTYSNDLYTYPLGVDGGESLREVAARWVASAWAGNGNDDTVPQEVLRRRETESSGVVAALRECTPSSLPWATPDRQQMKFFEALVRLASHCLPTPVCPHPPLCSFCFSSLLTSLVFQTAALSASYSPATATTTATAARPLAKIEQVLPVMLPRLAALVRRSLEWGRAAPQAGSSAASSIQCLAVSATALGALARTARTTTDNPLPPTTLARDAAEATAQTTGFVERLPPGQLLHGDTSAVLFQLLLQRVAAPPGGCSDEDPAGAVRLATAVAQRVDRRGLLLWSTQQCLSGLLATTALLERDSLAGAATPLAPAPALAPVRRLAEDILLSMQHLRLQQLSASEATRFLSCAAVLEAGAPSSAPSSTRTVWEAACHRVLTLLPHLSRKDRAKVAGTLLRVPTAGAAQGRLMQALLRDSRGGGSAGSARDLRRQLLSLLAEAPAATLLDHLEAAVRQGVPAGSAEGAGATDAAEEVVQLLSLLHRRLPLSPPEAARLLACYPAAAAAAPTAAAPGELTRRLERSWDHALLSAVVATLTPDAEADLRQVAASCRVLLVICAVLATRGPKWAEAVTAETAETYRGLRAGLASVVEVCLAASTRGPVGGPALWALATAADLFCAWPLPPGPDTTASAAVRRRVEKVCSGATAGRGDDPPEALLEVLVLMGSWGAGEPGPLRRLVMARVCELVEGQAEERALDPAALLRTVQRLCHMPLLPPLVATLHRLVTALTCNSGDPLPLGAMTAILRSSSVPAGGGLGSSSGFDRAEVALTGTAWTAGPGAGPQAPRYYPDPILDLYVRLLCHHYDTGAARPVSMGDADGLLTFFDERAGDAVALERAFAILLTRRLGQATALLPTASAQLGSPSPPRRTQPVLPTQGLLRLLPHAETMRRGGRFCSVSVGAALFAQLCSAEVLAPLQRIGDLLPLAGCLGTPLCSETHYDQRLADALQDKAMAVVRGTVAEGGSRVLMDTAREKALLIAYLIRADLTPRDDFLEALPNTLDKRTHAAGHIPPVSRLLLLRCTPARLFEDKMPLAKTGPAADPVYGLANPKKALGPLAVLLSSAAGAGAARSGRKRSGGGGDGRWVEIAAVTADGCFVVEARRPYTVARFHTAPSAPSKELNKKQKTVGRRLTPRGDVALLKPAEGRFEMAEEATEPPKARRRTAGTPKLPFTFFGLCCPFTSAVLARAARNMSCWREQLTALFQQYDPSKVDRVDGLLTKYAGKEEDLLKVLSSKYASGRAPASPAGSSPPQNSSLFVSSTAPSSSSSSSRPSPANSSGAPSCSVSTSTYHRRLTALYEQYQPSWVPRVAEQLARYPGREEDVIRAAIKRFGPEKAPALTAATAPGSVAAAEINAPPNNPKDEGASSRAAADEGASSRAAADEGASSRAAVDEGASSRAAADEGASSRAAVDEGASSRAAADEGASSRAAPAAEPLQMKEPAAGPASSRAAADEGASSRAAVDEGASSRAAADEGASSRAAADEGASSRAAVDEGASSRAAADEGASSRAAVDEGASSRAAADEGASSRAAVDEGASSRAAADEGASSRAAADEGASSRAAADEGASSRARDKSNAAGSAASPRSASRVVAHTSPRSRTTTAQKAPGHVKASTVREVAPPQPRRACCTPQLWERFFTSLGSITLRGDVCVDREAGLFLLEVALGHEPAAGVALPAGLWITREEFNTALRSGLGAGQSRATAAAAAASMAAFLDKCASCVCSRRDAARWPAQTSSFLGFLCVLPAVEPLWQRCWIRVRRDNVVFYNPDTNRQRLAVPYAAVRSCCRCVGAEPLPREVARFAAHAVALQMTEEEHPVILRVYPESAEAAQLLLRRCRGSAPPPALLAAGPHAAEQEAIDLAHLAVNGLQLSRVWAKADSGPPTGFRPYKVGFLGGGLIFTPANGATTWRRWAGEDMLDVAPAANIPGNLPPQLRHLFPLLIRGSDGRTCFLVADSLASRSHLTWQLRRCKARCAFLPTPSGTSSGLREVLAALPSGMPGEEPDAVAPALPAILAVGGAGGLS